MRVSTMILLSILAALAVFALPWDGGPVAWMPSDDEVARKFEKRHKDWEVVVVSSGNGDNDGRGYTIIYRTRSGGPKKAAYWSLRSSGEFFGWKLDGEDLHRN